MILLPKNILIPFMIISEDGSKEYVKNFSAIFHSMYPAGYLDASRQDEGIADVMIHRHVSGDNGFIK
jgi:hypothetical protein